MAMPMPEHLKSSTRATRVLLNTDLISLWVLWLPLGQRKEDSGRWADKDGRRMLSN